MAEQGIVEVAEKETVEVAEKGTLEVAEKGTLKVAVEGTLEVAEKGTVKCGGERNCGSGRVSDLAGFIEWWGYLCQEVKSDGSFMSGCYE